MSYVELHCKSNFSFLEGASHADELLQRAAELGYAGLAITDRNSLAGIVRAHTAAKDAKLRLIVGAELHPIDGPPLVVWPSDRAAYARLCRIITRGRL
ncbi:MAG: PHP domain-containing protein, partial [Planctomycetales bacterium]|nr:PHP domain-containing protein [Planctomycetales bacterium]